MTYEMQYLHVFVYKCGHMHDAGNASSVPHLPKPPQVNTDRP